MLLLIVFCVTIYGVMFCVLLFIVLCYLVFTCCTFNQDNYVIFSGIQICDILKIDFSPPPLSLSLPPSLFPSLPPSPLSLSLSPSLPLSLPPSLPPPEPA